MGGHLLAGPAALREGRVLVATKAMPPTHTNYAFMPNA